MSRPQDAYRSALGKVAASDEWKARTLAAMQAAGSPAAPRLRVAKNPRRAWKGALAAAACLILVGIPVLRYAPLPGFGSAGGAAAPNAAAYDVAGEAAGGEAEPRAAAPQMMAMAPGEENGQAAEKSEVSADSLPAPALAAVEGLPEAGEPVDSMLTRVGEDETSVYYLAGSLEGAEAVYEDGSRQPLADALASGRVTLADLQRLGVALTAEPKAG